MSVVKPIVVLFVALLCYGFMSPLGPLLCFIIVYIYYVPYCSIFLVRQRTPVPAEGVYVIWSCFRVCVCVCVWVGEGGCRISRGWNFVRSIVFFSADSHGATPLLRCFFVFVFLFAWVGGFICGVCFVIIWSSSLLLSEHQDGSFSLCFLSLRFE